MNTRKINTTFEIEDNDLVQYAFEKELRNYFNNSIVHFQVLPNTSKMYDNDSRFRELCKKYKTARVEKERYINNHNRKFK